MSVYSTAVLALNPVAYWQLNETSGTTLADSSGNGFTATLHGTAGTNYKLNQPSIVPSDSGGSIFFDGVAGFAVSNTITPLNLGISVLTVCAWGVIPGGTSTDYMIRCVNQFSFGVNYPSTGIEMLGVVNTAQVASTQDVVVRNSPAVTPDGASVTAIYFMMLLYNGVTMQLLQNAISVASTPYNKKINSVANSVGIGGGPSGQNLFTGYLQHLAVFNSALTSSQYQNLYSVGLQGITPVVNATSSLVFPWSQQILAANPLRTRVTITNDSDALIWLALGPTANTHSGIVIYPGGGRYICDDYTGVISAIHGWPIGTKNVCIQEETEPIING